MTDSSSPESELTETGVTTTHSTTGELIISRAFAAPREMVYRAFTDPDKLASWFGPSDSPSRATRWTSIHGRAGTSVS